MGRGGIPFPPLGFLYSLREQFPQFAQQGQGGGYMQQDAEECWTNLLYVLREKLKGSGGEGSSSVESMLGIGTRLRLKCEESQEELQPVRGIDLIVVKFRGWVWGGALC